MVGRYREVEDGHIKICNFLCICDESNHINIQDGSMNGVNMWMRSWMSTWIYDGHING